MKTQKSLQSMVTMTNHVMMKKELMIIIPLMKFQKAAAQQMILIMKQSSTMYKMTMKVLVLMIFQNKLKNNVMAMMKNQ